MCAGGVRFSNSNRITHSDYRILLLLKMHIPTYNSFYGAVGGAFGSWSILLLYGKECHEHLSKSLNLCSAGLKIHEQNRNEIFQSTIPFYCMFCCVIGDHCHTPRASDVI